MDLLPLTMIWVIIGMIFVSVVISVIFILINKCISKRGKHKITNPSLQKGTAFKVSSNKYQETNLKGNIPSLPPRTQFLTAEAQSYENLAEVPNYEQSMPEYEQSGPDYEQSKPDYVQSMPDYEQNGPDYVQGMPDYEQSGPDYVQGMPDYEQSGPDYVQGMPDYEQSRPDYEQSMPDYEQSMPDYEQALAELPDYLNIEDEEVILPPLLPYHDADPTADNASSEDYDDIGGEDGTQDEEDYDDVG
ncbi:uncharacterized protein LOC117812490 [Notolabrus celidotus]|uniref:uncharacterized protein LOC117812490 n=1 Tax=Notolabrus celidotus TaxID=1203425 RepID=UPI0014904347|nr:uncharacterized protein LOC117812490 [Notolabrus celidotus]XP_034539168.1 uncharacterized protein LOC117812490 [Notolabrus celidotus]